MPMPDEVNKALLALITEKNEAMLRKRGEEARPKEEEHRAATPQSMKTWSSEYYSTRKKPQRRELELPELEEEDAVYR